MTGAHGSASGEITNVPAKARQWRMGHLPHRAAGQTMPWRWAKVVAAALVLTPSFVKMLLM
jgi:hypothetical protein